MGTKMTLSARAELTNAVRRRYSAATSAEKRKILDEFIAVTGYHEKSAIRALNAEPTVKKRQTRVRPSLYDEVVRAALIVLWEASDRVCGKRLRALLPILLPARTLSPEAPNSPRKARKTVASGCACSRRRHRATQKSPFQQQAAWACAGSVQLHRSLD